MRLTEESIISENKRVCECGCQVEPKIGNRFVNGHNRRDKHNAIQRGKDNPNWRGGKYKSHGYYYVYKPEHYYATSDGYVKEHRLIYEASHNCCLLPSTVVHHINGIKDDNRIDNLQLFTTHAEHVSFEQKGRIMSEISRMRLSKARKGMKFTEEHRRNISKVNYRRYSLRS